MFKLPAFFMLCIVFVVMGCGNNSGDNGGDQENSDLASVESELRQLLDEHYLLSGIDFTVLIKSKNGHVFEHSTGTSTSSTVYRSASTSKWVTSAVILYLVETGVLELTNHPQDDISFWPVTGELANIELSQLLSFTSGLISEPFCINRQLVDFVDCLETIKSDNEAIAPTPGTVFDYSSTHMQVAGLMAINATGLADWHAVFDLFKTQTGLFSQAVYSLPSANNPRLAGGMEWTAKEYLDFLTALFNNDIFSANLSEQMFSEQIQTASIENSPAADAGYDWGYGFGNWIECEQRADCGIVNRVSSPGTYGAYPFIDFEHQYYGIIAREGDIGTAFEGYDTYQIIRDQLKEWATF